MSVLLTLSFNAGAEDLGVHGKLYDIAEPDLLKGINDRLLSMQESGELSALKYQMQEDTKSYVLSPPRVEGIIKTVKPRSWTYDPSINVHEDIKDSDGRLIQKAGTRVNPLERIRLSKSLLFIDGSDVEQLQWAIDIYKKENTKIIFIGGEVIRLMDEHKIRFYFDQKGNLTSKFGIKQVPAIVRQEGNLLRIKEVVL